MYFFPTTIPSSLSGILKIALLPYYHSMGQNIELSTIVVDSTHAFHQAEYSHFIYVYKKI